MNKRIPRFETDEEAEAFLERDDLSDYIDARYMRPVHFEFEKKEARVNMRVPRALLDAVKARAAERGIPYQRFIREVLERAVRA